MLSLAVYATRPPSCSQPARSDQLCLERTTSFVAARSGPAFALVKSTLDHGHAFTGAQLTQRATFCVESQRVHAYINSSSARGDSVDHSLLHPFHPEHVANAFTCAKRDTRWFSEKFQVTPKLRHVAIEHPKFEDDVPQFNGKIR